MYPEARKEITRDVVRFIRKAPGMNFVAFTFANERQLDHVIDQELEYFAPMKQPFTWKVYEHDLLPSLKDKLSSRSFVSDDGDGDVMVLDVKNASACAVPACDHRYSPHRYAVKVSKMSSMFWIKVWGGHNTWVNDRLGNASARSPVI